MRDDNMNSGIMSFTVWFYSVLSAWYMWVILSITNLVLKVFFASSYAPTVTTVRAATCTASFICSGCYGSDCHEFIIQPLNCMFTTTTHSCSQLAKHSGLVGGPTLQNMMLCSRYPSSISFESSRTTCQYPLVTCTVSFQKKCLCSQLQKCFITLRQQYNFVRFKKKRLFGLQ